MHRVKIPKPEVFKAAEALEDSIEEGVRTKDGRHFSTVEMSSLLKVTQYYRALLDKFMGSPPDEILSYAEEVVREVELGTHTHDADEKALIAWLETIAAAYRFYKTKWDAAILGLGTCPMGHEHLMRRPDETTAEYTARIVAAFREFAIDCTAQIGKERLLYPEEASEAATPPPLKVEIPDVPEGDGDVVDAEFTPPAEEEPEGHVERRFLSPFLMSGVRFESTIVKNCPAARTSRSMGEDKKEYVVVVVPGKFAEIIDSLAKTCGMKIDEGDEWKPYEEVTGGATE